MAETIAAFVSGLQQLLAWPTPLYLFAGVLIGSAVGILPGLGGPAAMAFLLPAVIPLEPIHGFVLLTAAAAVTISAGDLTSILLGVPGETTAAAIVADGHALTRRGEGRRASGAAILSSFAGSLIGIAVLIALIPIAQPLLVRVQSPELAALALLGVALLVPLSHAEPVKGVLAGALGLAMATIGADPAIGSPRFTFGQLSLWDGLGLLTVALGLFAVPEVLESVRKGGVPVGPVPRQTRGIREGLRDTIRHSGLVARCSAIGAAIGVLPGVGASVAQWVAYGHAQQTSRTPDDFGRGAIEGVIGPASATTATLGGALVPTLSLGIPGSLTTSFLLSALIIKGINPGPVMLVPDAAGGHLSLVFALVWCVVLASVIGAALGSASLGWIAGLAAMRPARLFPIVLTLVLIGAVGERHSTIDLAILFGIGVAGYALTRLGWPRAPMMLGFVLGSLIERRVRLSAAVYGWSWLTRPSVLVLVGLAAAFVFVTSRSRARGGRAAPAVSSRRSLGDLAMSGGIALVSVVGVAQSLTFTGGSGSFPVAAFGVTLVLSLVVLARSALGLARADRAGQPWVPVQELESLGWLAWFVVNSWLFGLVGGAMLASAVFFRWRARESWPATVVFTAALGLAARLIVHELMHLV